MATINVTVTDTTKGPFQVLALFSTNPPAGVTVTPTFTTGAPGGAPRIAEQLNVQAAGGNSGNGGNGGFYGGGGGGLGFSSGNGGSGGPGIVVITYTP